MLIRDAAPADARLLLQLLRQIADSSEGLAHGPQTPDGELHAMLDQCRTFVVEEEGRVVGLNAVRVLDLADRLPGMQHRRMAFIVAFGVDRAERRRGYGAALFRHMREWLRDKGVTLLSLNVAASNQTAQAFYRRMGLEARSVQMEQVLS
ncbi:GNAT family N-acetyltransferase [Ensifer soli]|uniref:GNAT family N-acetyltransferase n=1 Tax=Ciceribacter sp. sgz301302 TaxID=3342379 RepID=UPI0035B8846F